MKVVEVFESIQGEGPLVGVPCLFIRVWGCPLRCSSCDTKYSYEGPYKELSVSEIVNTIELSHRDYVVWTGGEPALYADEIVKVIDAIWPEKFFSMETNGTVMDTDLVLSLDYVVVSPKKNYKKVDDVIAWWGSFGNVDFKFVIGSSEWTWSLEEVKHIVKEFSLNKKRVWLMPEGTTPKELDRFSKQIWEFCVKNGFRYSDRLHIRVWNGIRGK